MIKMENFSSFKKDIVNSLSACTPSKYEFPDCINIGFDRVSIIRGSDNNIYQYLDEMCNKEYMHKWNQSVGKYFYKDLKKNDLDNYYEINFSNYKAIIKSLDEEEYESLKNNSILCENLIKSDNIYFIIIKVIEKDSLYTSRISYNSYFSDNNEVEIDNNEEEEYEFSDDNKEELSSISLFDD